MKKKVVIATKNEGKKTTYEHLFNGTDFIVLSLKDLGILDEVAEDGTTYEENSKKKALAYIAKTNLPTISDDSGIEIDALNGEPGIKSRRWLGYEATDEELYNHMVTVSKTLPDDKRGAQYRAVVTVAFPNGEFYQATGITRGVIAKEPRTDIAKGYPFDSFFYLPKAKKFYYKNELTEEEEKEYNHRYLALQQLLPYLEKYYNT